MVQSDSCLWVLISQKHFEMEHSADCLETQLIILILHIHIAARLIEKYMILPTLLSH